MVGEMAVLGAGSAQLAKELAAHDGQLGRGGIRSARLVARPLLSVRRFPRERSGVIPERWRKERSHFRVTIAAWDLIA
jgi:hypothetical protein